MQRIFNVLGHLIIAGRPEKPPLGVTGNAWQKWPTRKLWALQTSEIWWIRELPLQHYGLKNTSWFRIKKLLPQWPTPEPLCACNICNCQKEWCWVLYLSHHKQNLDTGIVFNMAMGTPIFHDCFPEENTEAAGVWLQAPSCLLVLEKGKMGQDEEGWRTSRRLPSNSLPISSNSISWHQERWPSGGQCRETHMDGWASSTVMLSSIIEDKGVRDTFSIVQSLCRLYIESTYFH